MAPAQIRPGAVFSPLAKLAENVVIDAFAIVHDHVEIGASPSRLPFHPSCALRLRLHRPGYAPFVAP